MGFLIFFVYLFAIIVVFSRRGALAGCFSIPMGLIAGVWIGIASAFNSDFSGYIFPLVLTGGLALMVFLPGKRDPDDARPSYNRNEGAGSTWQDKPVSPVLNNTDGRIWQPSTGEAPQEWHNGVPSTATEIVEVDRADYLPATDDAGDLAARKLDEDYENGVIDRATYVAERKKLAQ